MKKMLLLGIILLAIVIAIINPVKIAYQISNIRPIFLIPIALFSILAYFIQTLRFYLLIDGKVRLARLFQIVSSASIINFIFPASGGDIILRPYILKKLEKLKGTSRIVLGERLGDLSTLGIAVLISTLMLFPHLVLYALIPAAALAFLFIEWKIMRNPLKVAIIIIFSLLNFISICMAVYFGCLGFNISPEVLAIQLYIISTFIGVLSFIPGGLGSSELSLGGLFALFGFPASAGVTILLTVKAVMFICSFALSISILKRFK